VEAIRALMVAKRAARSERIQTVNQARAPVLTGPDDIRIRFAGHATDALVAELAALRPRSGSMVRYHTLLSLREFGRRAQFLDQQLDRLDELIVPLVTDRAPGPLARYGVGPHTASSPEMLLHALTAHRSINLNEPGRQRYNLLDDSP
jgi:transposase